VNRQASIEWVAQQLWLNGSASKKAAPGVAALIVDGLARQWEGDQTVAATDQVTRDTSLQVTLIDAPDKRSEDYGRETQRTYKVSDGTTTHKVRIRFGADSRFGYIVENLVGGKWHHLLDGDLIYERTWPDGRTTVLSVGEIPFEEAALRAANVLL
jgi:hypothetical protein